jgi:hypothetical protein
MKIRTLFQNIVRWVGQTQAHTDRQTDRMKVVPIAIKRLGLIQTRDASSSSTLYYTFCAKSAYNTSVRIFHFLT